MKRINYGNNSNVNNDSRMSRLNRTSQDSANVAPDYDNNDGYSERYNGVMPDDESEPQSDQVVARKPIKKHHYLRDAFIGVAVVICLLVGASWYTNHEDSNQANNQPQPTRVDKTVNNTTNNYQKPNQQQDNQIRNLQNELDSMGLQQQQTQQLLNKFANIQNDTTRNEVYKHAQLVRYVPVQPIQRTIIEKVLN